VLPHGLLPGCQSAQVDFCTLLVLQESRKNGRTDRRGDDCSFLKLVECLAELVLGVRYDRPVPRVRLLKRLARDETEDGTTFAPFVSAMEPVLRGAAPASQTGTYIEEVMTAKVIPMWNF